MGIPDHLAWLFRNLYAGQEATVRTGHGTHTGSKWEKEYFKAVYCHPACLTYMQCTSWETLGWRKHKLESELPGEISVTSHMQMIAPLWQEVRGTFKKPLDESARGEWKIWLQAQHSENEDHGKWFRKQRSWQLVPSLRRKYMGKQCQTLFWGVQKSLQMIAAMELKDAYSLEGKLWPTLIAYSKAETLLCQQRSI